MKKMGFGVIIVFEILFFFYLAIEDISMSGKVDYITIINHNRQIIAVTFVTILIAPFMKSLISDGEIKPEDAMKKGQMANPAFARANNMDEDVVDLHAHAIAGTDPLKGSSIKSANSKSVKRKTKFDDEPPRKKANNRPKIQKKEGFV